MSFGLLFSPAGSAGACRVRVRPERSRRRTGPATDRGLDFHAGNPLSSVLARGQEQDLPGSLATHPVTLRRSTTPDDPLHLASSGASGAAPTRLTMKASSIYRFRGFPRRFITCCLRFTTGVTARHARLASGWRAAPLPGGSRTRWIATRGFRSSHPPPQGFPWRNNRSGKPVLSHATRSSLAAEHAVEYGLGDRRGRGSVATTVLIPGRPNNYTAEPRCCPTAPGRDSPAPRATLPSNWYDVLRLTGTRAQLPQWPTLPQASRPRHFAHRRSALRGCERPPR